MNKNQQKSYKRSIARKLRVRKHLRGTSVKPRLCVVKSNKNILIQLIDDEQGVTMGAASTLDKEFKNSEFSKKNKASAAKLGARIAEIATQKNVKEVVFDRGCHKFHGILAEVANAARDGGLQF